MIRKHATLAALCAAAVAAVPATADAKAKPRPKPLQTATFKATVSGSQVTTWKYDRPYDDSNPCVPEAHGYGDSSIYFAGRPFKLTFTMPPKKKPNLFGTRGRPAVQIAPYPYQLAVKADRDTDFNYGQPGPKCDGENGGGVDPNVEQKDCGERTGTIRARFFYDWRGVLDDAVPTDHSRDRNALKLETYWPEYNGSDNGQLEDAYKRCSLNEQTWAERQGLTYTAGAKLIESRLFDKKRRTFRTSAGYITPITGEFVKGKTILAWNLKLTRIK